LRTGVFLTHRAGLFKIFDFLARANLGLQFALTGSLHLGLSWGVMNIDLNNDQGILSARDSYEYFFGINSRVNF